MYKRFTINIVSQFNILQIIMTEQLTNLQGVSLQQYHAVLFDINLLKDVDLQMFPPRRVHFLVHALINNTKLPSQRSMIRSQKRNERKSGADKADQAVGRPTRQVRPVRRVVRRRAFFVPNKFGPKSRGRGGRNDRGRARPREDGRTRPIDTRRTRPIDFSVGALQLNRPPRTYPMGIPGQQVLQNLPTMPTNLNPMLPPPGFSLLPIPNPYLSPMDPNLPQLGSLPIANFPVSMPPVYPGNQPIPNGFCLPHLVDQNLLEPVSEQKVEVVSSEAQKKKTPLPTEIVRKLLKRQLPKEANKSFKTQAPEWICLKTYRDQTMAKIEVYRTEQKSKVMPLISDKLVEDVPLYFQKKKANQKRRRQEKHELIKKNRRALVDLFGNAVFQRGWPISRREIKIALGIEEQNAPKVENVSKFLEMAEKKEELKGLEKNSSTESETKQEVKLEESMKEVSLTQRDVQE